MSPVYLPASGKTPVKYSGVQEEAMESKRGKMEE
jgi:hypothetical protein